MARSIVSFTSAGILGLLLTIATGATAKAQTPVAVESAVYSSATPATISTVRWNGVRYGAGYRGVYRGAYRPYYGSYYRPYYRPLVVRPLAPRVYSYYAPYATYYSPYPGYVVPAQPYVAGGAGVYVW